MDRPDGNVAKGGIGTKLTPVVEAWLAGLGQVSGAGLI